MKICGIRPLNILTPRRGITLITSLLSTGKDAVVQRSRRALLTPTTLR
nr:MAG TPA: hypothetical protein [Caudoviricetes sp.]